jgi:hypothetical protein
VTLGFRGNVTRGLGSGVTVLQQIEDSTAYQAIGDTTDPLERLRGLRQGVHSAPSTPSVEAAMSKANQQQHTTLSAKEPRKEPKIYRNLNCNCGAGAK